MSVSKIFKLLITIVACVVVGGVILNVLLPNVFNQLINAVEGQIFRATSLQFDFNKDGIVGQTDKNYSNAAGASSTMEDEGGSGEGAGVEGIN